MTNWDDENLSTTTPAITQKQILLSFYVTQVGLLVIALFLLWWQGRLTGNLFGFDQTRLWMWGSVAGIAVVALDLGLVRWLPEKMLDDGGINQLLFAGRSPVHILFIALVAAFVEEMFFRGAVQHWLGVWGTSILFLLVHTRYLRRWVLALMLGLISLLFGWMVEWSGVLAPAIIAHAMVDFLLGMYLRYFHE